VVNCPGENGYSLHQGVIRKDQQIWVGENLALRTKINVALHDASLGSHSGIIATYHRVKKIFYWSGLKTDVELFVNQCGTCQQAKSTKQYPFGLCQQKLDKT
jgi:hypothetical protein